MVPIKLCWLILTQFFCALLLRIWDVCGVQYEPELFPGLIYRMKQPKIVLLIFVSGKIVLTGAKVHFIPHHLLSVQTQYP